MSFLQFERCLHIDGYWKFAGVARATGFHIIYNEKIKLFAK